MQVAWATDTHLDFLRTPQAVENYAQQLKASNSEAVFITGDISSSEILTPHLTILDQVLDVPVLFILGNHDFYHGSIYETRDAVREMCLTSKNLKYMTFEAYPIRLHDNVYVIGHDGWYDFRFGSGNPKNFIMNDWIYTSEFAQTVHKFGGNWVVDNKKIIEISQGLAQQAVEHIKMVASLIPENSEVHILTHVPPFSETAKYKGRPSDHDAMSVFSSKIIGEAILAITPRFSRVDVWAGHTHDPASAKINDKLFCHVQAAEYRFPSYKIIDI